MICQFFRNFRTQKRHFTLSADSLAAVGLESAPWGL